MSKEEKVSYHQAVLISDTHIGCQLALMHPDGGELDNGNLVPQNELQEKIWALWDELWRVHVPELTEGEPYALIHLGDIIDNTHHRATHQWSFNEADQKRHAVKVLQPLVDSPLVQDFFVVRGTEAHTAPSAKDDEEIAERLGAKTNKWGRHTRYRLKLRLGDTGLLVCQHHVGTTSNSAYATSAPYRNLIEQLVRSARWATEIPDVVAFGHRHQHISAHTTTHKGRASVVCVPAWQATTPFGYRVAGSSVPEFGAVVVRWNKVDGCYLREKLWPIIDDEIEHYEEEEIEDGNS